VPVGRYTVRPTMTAVRKLVVLRRLAGGPRRRRRCRTGSGVVQSMRAFPLAGCHLGAAQAGDRFADHRSSVVRNGNWVSVPTTGT
jgi:hypothetical protein